MPTTTKPTRYKRTWALLAASCSDGWKQSYTTAFVFLLCWTEEAEERLASVKLERLHWLR